MSEVNLKVNTSRLSDDSFEIVKRAYQENPAPKDINALRKLINETPQLWKDIFDLTRMVQANLIEHVIDREAAQISIEKDVQEMRRDLGYETASPMERLLIENIITTWLRLNWAEFNLTIRMDQDLQLAVHEFWDQRLSIAQRRHLRAVETLAKVRRLLAPIAQVNIAEDGSQQLNLVGNISPRTD
jgi:hypothetical protein